MKKRIFALVCMAATVAAADSPKFVTASMMDRRNGLTDEQYEYLWSIGRKPSVDANTARDWMYRASRYQNVTNWLDICGKTNNFAALAFSLQQSVEPLVASNRLLRSAAVAFSNACATARADAASHSNRLEKITAFLTEKKNAARLSTTKAIYQAIIDKLNEVGE